MRCFSGQLLALRPVFLNQNVVTVVTTDTTCVFLNDLGTHGYHGTHKCGSGMRGIQTRILKPYLWVPWLPQSTEMWEDIVVTGTP